MTDDTTIHDACEQQECFIPSSRRQFLRDSFLAASGALVALGMPRSRALAMPLAFTDARPTSRSTRAYAIPAADGAQIDKANDLILVRWQNVIYAFALSCPHQNTALRWSASDNTFECPKHHSRFTANGTYVPDSGRATRDMDRLAIRREGDGIVVDLDQLYTEDDGAKWQASVVRL